MSDQRLPAERSAAEQACMHVMDRIIRDPRITYYLGPGSETFVLLTNAVAEIRGETPKAYREYITPHLRTERP